MQPKVIALFKKCIAKRHLDELYIKNRNIEQWLESLSDSYPQFNFTYTKFKKMVLKKASEYYHSRKSKISKAMSIAISFTKGSIRQAEREIETLSGEELDSMKVSIAGINFYELFLFCRITTHLFNFLPCLILFIHIRLFEIIWVQLHRI